MKEQTFVQWLRARVPREDRGGQKRLADAVGVVPAMVSKWLAGKPTPEPDRVLRIARHFGMAALPVLRLAHPALMDELEIKIPAARDSRRPSHDCWETIGAAPLRSIGRLDDKHVAVLEIHEIIRGAKKQQQIDHVVVALCEAMGVIPKKKADELREVLVAGWRPG